MLPATCCHVVMSPFHSKSVPWVCTVRLLVFVSVKGKHIGGPTINPAMRSQPVFIQHLQGVTAEVQEEARQWALATGSLSQTMTVAASVDRPFHVPAGAAERPKSSVSGYDDPVSSLTRLGAGVTDNLIARIPDERDEFADVLVNDKSGVHVKGKATAAAATVRCFFPHRSLFWVAIWILGCNSTLGVSRTSLYHGILLTSAPMRHLCSDSPDF